MDEILGASALSLGRAIRAKRLSSAEVVAAYLQRIDQVNPAINAVVQRRDERALPLGVEGTVGYCLPYSLTGYPSAVVWAGTSPQGMPIGVQEVSWPWREDVALAVAGRIEPTLGDWRPPDEGFGVTGGQGDRENDASTP